MNNNQHKARRSKENKYKMMKSLYESFFERNQRKNVFINSKIKAI